MSHLEMPRFPRGFLFADTPVDSPPTFIPGPLLPNFWVHPWTNIEFAGSLHQFVVIIGHAIPTRPDQGHAPAANLLTSLEQGECAFFRALADYSGRHAIIFGSIGNIRVVNDATSMRAVFYAVDGGVIASHASLVEQALGGETMRKELPFRYGYPGNLTPFARTKILTPNTYYWMTANLVRRFWPIVPLAPRTVDEAAAHLLEASTFAFRTMTRGQQVGLTLTAGLDSRAVLAVALHSGMEFETYTYGDDPASEVDRLVARDLANRYGIKHTPVEQKINDPVLDERVRESHYALHHAGWIGALRDYFSNPKSVAVIGNLLEIGRSNYSPARVKGAAAPVTAKAMSALHHRKVGDAVARRIRGYGQERFRQESQAAFHRFVEETGYHHPLGLLDPFDQFYWEHRMGTWQGVAMGERDFYAEPFIPFNARSIFESMLGVSLQERQKNSTVLRMIQMVDPDLLVLPINPKSWPLVEPNRS